MIWIAILVALVISAAAVLAVVWPLFKSGPAPIIVEDDELTDLLYRKDATLNAIKELEFDYHVGKFSQEDYERFDQRLRRQAITLMQQIEKEAPESASLDAALEAQIERLRQVPSQPAAATTQLSRDGAFSSASLSTATEPSNAIGSPAAPKAASFCTNCGSPLEAHHKFCAICGTPAVSSPVPVNE